MVDRAADLCAAGLDGWQLLRTHDPVERLTLTVLAEKTAKRREHERKALAAEIVNALARSLK